MTFNEWAKTYFGEGLSAPAGFKDAWDAAVAAERERIADLWAGCVTEAEGHGPVDIGASIRADRLIDA